MNGDFFALMLRMKYINRWGLMRSVHNENLSEHSLECAVLAHALAVIGNIYFGKSYNEEKIALKAMYHDACEIVTGDLPTPVKYFNSDTKEAYNSVEEAAIKRFMDLLPEEMKQEYRDIFEQTEEEHKIVKAADRLCAYIKCLNETKLGNHEYSSALISVEKSIKENNCEELSFFMENCLDSFNKTLDELQIK